MTPSVLMPKPASPTTDPGARPKQGVLLFLRLQRAALQGPPGPRRTCALPTKSLWQAQMPSPLSPSRAAACAILQGHFSPPRPFSALVGRAHYQPGHHRGRGNPKLSGHSTKAREAREAAVLGQRMDSPSSEPRVPPPHPLLLPPDPAHFPDGLGTPGASLKGTPGTT